MSATHPYLDWPGPIAFAHRGGASAAPENTLAAFQHAVDLGYRYLETDVHLTADGVLVAFHDDVLDRVTDRAGRIADLTWQEVSEARVDGREPIPLMADLLATWPEARFNIDTKSDATVEPLAALITQAGAAHRVCVGSFSDARLRRIRQLVPDACTSMGPREVARLRAASAGAPAGRFAAQCVQVPPRAAGMRLVTRRFVEAAHRRDLAVHVWTIDDESQMHELLDTGVDGVMTDRPAVLRDVMVERDEWHG